MAFLLNFIPNIGPVVAVLVPLPVVLLDPTLSSAQAILAFVLPTIMQTLIGVWNAAFKASVLTFPLSIWDMLCKSNSVSCRTFVEAVIFFELAPETLLSC